MTLTDSELKTGIPHPYRKLYGDKFFLEPGWEGNLIPVRINADEQYHFPNWTGYVQLCKMKNDPSTAVKRVRVG